MSDYGILHLGIDEMSSEVEAAWDDITRRLQMEKVEGPYRVFVGNHPHVNDNKEGIFILASDKETSVKGCSVTVCFWHDTNESKLKLAEELVRLANIGAEQERQHTTNKSPTSSWRDREPLL